MLARQRDEQFSPEVPDPCLCDAVHLHKCSEALILASHVTGKRSLYQFHRNSSSEIPSDWNIQRTPLYITANPINKSPVSTLSFNSLPVTWRTNSLTFNNCTLCLHCIYVFCIYLRKNSDLCHLQHKPIGFYNRDEKCLPRGTNWVFK